jgi:glycosyltransferase involved in cell wall biosynthesis
MKLRKDIPLLQLERFTDIPQVFHDLGTEIVHSHHASVDVLLSTMLVNSPAISQVVTTHGMYETVSPDDLKRQLPILHKRVDAFVYIAEKNLLPFPEIFRNSKRFVKISNAIEKSSACPVARHEIGVAPDDFVLCFVSRAIPEKGWEEAIEAVKFANASSKRCIHLLLIGDGPEFDRLSSRPKPDYVRFLGFRPNVMDYFATSDLGFLPSRFQGESCPLVLIECLLAGKPMLASNIGEIAQLLRTGEGVAGETFDLDDWAIPIQRVGKLIVKIANSRELYERMLACVADAAAKFDPLMMIECYEDVYRRGCDRKVRIVS